MTMEHKIGLVPSAGLGPSSTSHGSMWRAAAFQLRGTGSNPAGRAAENRIIWHGGARSGRSQSFVGPRPHVASQAIRRDSLEKRIPVSPVRFRYGRHAPLAQR